MFDHPATAAVLAEIGARALARRKRLGWTQAKVAERMYSSEVQVSRVELGKNMTIGTMIRVADALGLEPVDLLPDFPFGPTLGPPRRLASVGRSPGWKQRGPRPGPPGPRNGPQLPPPNRDVEWLTVIGFRVRSRRKALGWTQARLGKWLGFTDSSYVGRIENGRLNMRVSMLLRLAETLDISVSELLASRPHVPPGMVAKVRIPLVGQAPDNAAAPSRLESVGVYPYT